MARTVIFVNDHETKTSSPVHRADIGKIELSDNIELSEEPMYSVHRGLTDEALQEMLEEAESLNDGKAVELLVKEKERRIISKGGRVSYNDREVTFQSLAELALAVAPELKEHIQLAHSANWTLANEKRVVSLVVGDTHNFGVYVGSKHRLKGVSGPIWVNFSR